MAFKPEVDDMVPVNLDTHEAVKDLQAAGFSEGQAEVLTRLIAKSSDPDLSHLLTNAAYETGNAQLRSEIQSVRTDLQGEILATQIELHSAKTDILKWTIGAIGLQTIAILGAVAGIVRILVH